MRVKSGAVTIYDVAKEAKVSASTVSRVINNRSNVNEATKTKVLEVLKKMNYSPNETARGLVTKSSRMIGILIADIRATQHTSGIYYIERELAANGYSCLIHNTTRSASEMARYIRELTRWNVEGVVLIGSIFICDEVLQAIEEYMPKTPIVICNGYMKRPNIFGILSDEKTGMKELVRFLAEKGRKHPVMILNQISPSSADKEAGFRAGIEEYYPGEEANVLYTGATEEEIKEQTQRMLEDWPETDAVICSEDPLALAEIRALLDLGKCVPEDIAVAGVNNSMLAEVAVPRLTSLDNMLFSLSMTAAHHLLMLLNGKQVCHKIVIPTKIVEREST